MNFVDTHSHLYSSEFEADRDEVIERARQAGIHKILLPNIDLYSMDPMMKICRSYPDTCFPMIGLHPTSVKEDFQEHLNRMEGFLKTEKCVAIGEIGMDLYWDKTFLNQQQEVLSIQIDLARNFALPVSIHSRESYREIMDVLLSKKNDSPYSGVFHSFSGDVAQASQVISLGFKIGISGVVTFKNSAMLSEVVRDVQLEDLLLETDAPYLTPVPYRGKRNESAYIVNIARKIAEIKQVPVDEVARVTTQTARNLFNLE